MIASVFKEIINKYAQDQTQQPLDPTQIQLGQSIYDNEGNEYVVVGDDENTTDKVLMPADQAGQQVPQGVKSVEDTELSSTYSVQSQNPQVAASKVAQWDELEEIAEDIIIFAGEADGTASMDERGIITVETGNRASTEDFWELMDAKFRDKMNDVPYDVPEEHTFVFDILDLAPLRSKVAQMEEDVDWDDIQSAAMDVHAYSKQKDMHGLTEAVEYLTALVLSYIELPEDINMSELFKASKKLASIREAKEDTSPSGKREVNTDGPGRGLKAKGSQRRATKIGLEDPVWIVNDPGTESEFEDIFYKTNLIGLQRYMTGTGEDILVVGNTALYDNEEEAMEDARSRMAKRDMTAGVLPEFQHKEAVIRKLKEEDKDPNKPADQQIWGLYTHDGKKLLGRHPSEEAARKQEEAIKAHEGSRLKSGFKDILPEFKRGPIISADTEETSKSDKKRVKAFHDPEDYEDEFKSEFKEEDFDDHIEEDDLIIGESGYVEIMDCIQDMVRDGYAVVDVILNIGELFPKSKGEKVLEDARVKGIL